MSTKVTAILVAEAKPGKEVALQQAFLAVVARSKVEYGCLEYRIHVESTNPAKVLLYGTWEDEQSHYCHAEQDYIQQLVKRLSASDLLASPFTVYFLSHVSDVVKLSSVPFAHVVFVRLVAKPGKEDALQQALETVALQSAQESACVEYHVHRDVEDQAAFMLYEVWQSAQQHQQQFTKQYILDFGAFLEKEDVLVKPWWAILGREISE